MYFNDMSNKYVKYSEPPPPQKFQMAHADIVISLSFLTQNTFYIMFRWNKIFVSKIAIDCYRIIFLIWNAIY